MEIINGKDPELWKIARKRASFKQHLFSYLVINAFLWIIWLYTDGIHDESHGLPWPAWVSLGWGIGLAFNYFDAYHGYKDGQVEKEYEKLKKERQGK